MKFRVFLYFNCLILCACGETENFSVGVSMGGSGTGSTLPISTGGIGTTTPRPSDDFYTENEVNYLAWSIGKIETICGNAKINMQLIDNQSKQILDPGHGTFLSVINDTNITNASILVTVENSGQEQLYEYYDNCQPNIKLFNDEDNELQSSQQFICENDYFTNEYKSQEIKTYEYKFTLPKNEGKYTLSFVPNFSTSKPYSLENIMICPTLNYEVNVSQN